MFRRTNRRASTVIDVVGVNEYPKKRLHKSFKDDEHLYMLMEPCLGGELLTLLYEEKSLSHMAAKFYTACIVEAFSFMHSKGIIHRDLKPENILLDSRGFAKLIDFGMAKKVIAGKKTRTLCGTADYMAPEMVLKKGHDTAADIWSLGVLVFDILSGSSLFADKDDNDMQTCNNILQGINDVVFPNEIRKIAEDFIRKLCRSNPAPHRAGNTNAWMVQRIPMGGLTRQNNVKSSDDGSNFDCESSPEKADYPRIDDVTSWDPDF